MKDRGGATHDGLYVAHQVIESDERQFTFQVGVLAQMATGMAGIVMSYTSTKCLAARTDEPVFRTETLLDTENVSQ